MLRYENHKMISLLKKISCNFIKEVVVKNIIKNNLYTLQLIQMWSLTSLRICRIFGFEVDFQRDIRKGDWFEILYEKFIDDNDKVRDTGKIIYVYVC